MGRVAPAQPQYAPPVKRGAAKNKKKIKQKIKVKPKGKGKKAPAKGKKKGVIELNGAPDYVEYDLPKSVGKKKRKGYAESDVECIGKFNFYMRISPLGCICLNVSQIFLIAVAPP